MTLRRKTFPGLHFSRARSAARPFHGGCPGALHGYTVALLCKSRSPECTHNMFLNWHHTCWQNLRSEGVSGPIFAGTRSCRSLSASSTRSGFHGDTLQCGCAQQLPRVQAGGRRKVAERSLTTSRAQQYSVGRRVPGSSERCVKLQSCQSPCHGIEKVLFRYDAWYCWCEQARSALAGEQFLLHEVREPFFFLRGNEKHLRREALNILFVQQWPELPSRPRTAHKKVQRQDPNQERARRHHTSSFETKCARDETHLKHLRVSLGRTQTRDTRLQCDRTSQASQERATDSGS